jgi:hypothetical protein
MQSNEIFAENLFSRMTPDAMVEQLQPVIKDAVNYHIYKGYFHADVRDDIIQDISLRFLERGTDILKQFKGHSALKTYIKAVIFNFCGDLYRSKRYKKEGHENIEMAADLTEQSIPKKVLDDEYRKLTLLLEMYGKKKSRLILCLKLTYKLPVSRFDIRNYDLEVTKEETETILALTDPSKVNIKDKQIFEALNMVFNRIENKTNSIDSLRKWVDLKTDEMIHFMNGEPPFASYTREALQILIEKYFMKDEKN